jgi:phage regulator Rha-like protein
MQNNENFAGTPNELFPIIEHEGVHVVDSRLIAEALGVNHSDWFRNIILKHQGKITANFGALRFENGALMNKRYRGSNTVKFVLLTEDQSIFIATLSRNTEQVIAFKAKLVASFAVLRQDVAKLQACAKINYALP